MNRLFQLEYTKHLSSRVVLSLIVLGSVFYYLFNLRLPVSVFTIAGGSFTYIVPILVYCL